MSTAELHPVSEDTRRGRRFRARLDAVPPPARPQPEHFDQRMAVLLPFLFERAERAEPGVVRLTARGEPDVYLRTTSAEWRVVGGCCAGRGIYQLAMWAWDCSVMQASLGLQAALADVDAA